MSNCKRARWLETSEDIAQSASRPRLDRNKKRNSFHPTFADADALVTFFVGTSDSHTKFLIYKEFIGYYSEPLKKAFESDFVEGRTQTYNMDDVTPSVFRLFVKWLYAKEPHLVTLKDDEEEDERRMNKDWEEWEVCELAELWFFGDRFGVVPVSLLPQSPRK